MILTVNIKNGSLRIDRKKKIGFFELLRTRLGCLESLVVKGQRMRERRDRKETRLQSQSREGGCLLTTSANASDKKGGGFVRL